MSELRTSLYVEFKGDSEITTDRYEQISNILLKPLRTAWTYHKCDMTKLEQGWTGTEVTRSKVVRFAVLFFALTLGSACTVAGLLLFKASRSHAAKYKKLQAVYKEQKEKEQEALNKKAQLIPQPLHLQQPLHSLGSSVKTWASSLPESKVFPLTSVPAEQQQQTKKVLYPKEFVTFTMQARKEKVLDFEKILEAYPTQTLVEGDIKDLLKGNTVVKEIILPKMVQDLSETPAMNSKIALLRHIPKYAEGSVKVQFVANTGVSPLSSSYLDHLTTGEAQAIAKKLKQDPVVFGQILESMKMSPDKQTIKNIVAICKEMPDDEMISYLPFFTNSQGKEVSPIIKELMEELSVDTLVGLVKKHIQKAGELGWELVWQVSAGLDTGKSWDNDKLKDFWKQINTQATEIYEKANQSILLKLFEFTETRETLVKHLSLDQFKVLVHGIFLTNNSKQSGKGLLQYLENHFPVTGKEYLQRLVTFLEIDGLSTYSSLDTWDQGNLIQRLKSDELIFTQTIHLFVKHKMTKSLIKIYKEMTQEEFNKYFPVILKLSSYDMYPFEDMVGGYACQDQRGGYVLHLIKNKASADEIFAMFNLITSTQVGKLAQELIKKDEPCFELVFQKIVAETFKKVNDNVPEGKNRGLYDIACIFQEMTDHSSTQFNKYFPYVLKHSTAALPEGILQGVHGKILALYAEKLIDNTGVAAWDDAVKVGTYMLDYPAYTYDASQDALAPLIKKIDAKDQNTLNKIFQSKMHGVLVANMSMEQFKTLVAVINSLEEVKKYEEVWKLGEYLNECSQKLSYQDQVERMGFLFETTEGATKDVKAFLQKICKAAASPSSKIPPWWNHSHVTLVVWEVLRILKANGTQQEVESVMDIFEDDLSFAEFSTKIGVLCQKEDVPLLLSILQKHTKKATETFMAEMLKRGEDYLKPAFETFFKKPLRACKVLKKKLSIKTEKLPIIFSALGDTMDYENRLNIIKALLTCGSLNTKDAAVLEVLNKQTGDNKKAIDKVLAKSK